MPAEWERHAATWIAWPRARDDWPGRFAAIPFAFAEIVRCLSAHETVRIVVGGNAAEAAARERLTTDGISLERVQFFRWPTDRSWVRDSGPTFVRRPRRGELPAERAAVSWHFNGWAKYENWHRDDRLGGRIARALQLPLWRPRRAGARVVLEGGAIDVNGAGLLLATEECLLGEVQARNPGLSRLDVEQLLADYLGADRVLWLAAGLVGDDTHGHIDDVARFVGERTIVIARPPDRPDPNHAPLAENRARLDRAVGPDGRPFEVVELPMPTARTYSGQPVPASYLNFYIANDTVLVPTFNDPADREALGTLARLFPDRSVVGLFSGDLIWGLGSVHCLTQQEPAE